MLPSIYHRSATSSACLIDEAKKPPTGDMDPFQETPNTFHSRHQSIASINSSDSSLDQAYCSHNVSATSTDFEETSKSVKDPTSTSWYIERAQFLECLNEKLKTENEILVGTNRRLNEDLELAFQKYPKDENSFELINQLQFMQIELETRNNIISKLKSTIAQQYCALQKPNLEVTKLQRNLRECQHDLQSSLKLERWAMDELHRVQRIKCELQEKIMRVEQDKCLSEISANRCQAQLEAISQHWARVEVKFLRETKFFQKKLADKSEQVKCLQKVLSDNKKLQSNTVAFQNEELKHECRQCSELKIQVDCMEKRVFGLNKVVKDAERRLADVDQQNGRLQSESAVLSKSLADQTIVLNILNNYINQLESSKIDKNNANRDMHAQEEDNRTKLHRLKTDGIEHEAYSSKSQNLFPSQLNIKQVKMKMIKKGNPSKSIIDERFNCSAKNIFPNKSQSYEDMIPLCQTDVIDMCSFKLISPQQIVSETKKYTNPTKLNVDETKQLQVWKNVLQTEHNEKCKRYETHIRSLIQRAKTLLRSQQFAEAGFREINTECDRLKIKQVTLQGAHDQQNKKVSKLIAELWFLRNENTNRKPIITELHNCKNQIISKPYENEIEHSQIKKEFVCTEGSTIQARCEPDNIKRQSLGSFRSTLNMKHIRDVIKSANSATVSLNPLVHGISALHVELNALQLVVSEKSQLPSLMEELRSSGRY